MWKDSLARPMDVFLLLQEESSWKLIVFMLLLIGLWTIFVSFAVKFLPKKYNVYKKEIILFLVTLNFGLLFMGLFLTIVLLIFGLYWATFKVKKSDYKRIDFEEHFTKIPTVYCKFQENVLHQEPSKECNVDTYEMIKSMETVYNSAEQNNISNIKHLLSSEIDEIRLLAFSQISAYEKELLKRVKKLEEKKENAKTKDEIESYNYLLANAYWQFIFHGVADQNLVSFYLEKIEKYLQMSGKSVPVSILYGKISLYKKEYRIAREHFLRALHLGAAKHQVFSFLAEVEYELRNFNKVGDYMMDKMFNLDLKMKPYYVMWRH